MELEKILDDVAGKLLNLALSADLEIYEIGAKEILRATIISLVLQAKYEVLKDLLEWHDKWSEMHKEPFNWYGAVKAMMVMKDPQKPFHTLKTKEAKADE